MRGSDLRCRKLSFKAGAARGNVCCCVGELLGMEVGVYVEKNGVEEVMGGVEGGSLDWESLLTVFGLVINSLNISNSLVT